MKIYWISLQLLLRRFCITWQNSKRCQPARNTTPPSYSLIHILTLLCRQSAKSWLLRYLSKQFEMSVWNWIFINCVHLHFHLLRFLKILNSDYMLMFVLGTYNLYFDKYIYYKYICCCFVCNLFLFLLIYLFFVYIGILFAYLAKTQINTFIWCSYYNQCFNTSSIFIIHKNTHTKNFYHNYLSNFPISSYFGNSFTFLYFYLKYNNKF